ncbi:NAD-dependent epimerase/dehydratase family protein [Plantactinospora siamensis]|uniref:NAD-dependent epimerase/dehydratase family protein n=1 Tax=Plantactinospora siamensis TaxID=555372 RepID=A0ABV6P080_9ACTN
MSTHVIVGAGQVGSTAALLLAGRGERVRVVTRSGTGPEHPLIERVSADATDAGRLTELTRGAVALYNCANPQYHTWLTDWPPLSAALLTAAERTGATLATTSTLYSYGPVDGPMTEATPLAATHPKLRIRGEMWRAALAAHEAGRIRATEVRGSDYIQGRGLLSFGPGKAVLAGSRAYSPAPLDVPHTWTSTDDVARLLVTVAADERGWGRAWHVPSPAPLTVRELLTRFAQVAGAPTPKLTAIPYPVFWAAGVASPMVRELRTTRYQFTRPFIMDSTAATETFGRKPQPLDDALREAADQLRG